MMWSPIKQNIKGLLHSAGYYHLLHKWYKGHVNILMYHRFSTHPEPFKIPASDFAKQLHFLSHHFNFISLGHFEQVLSGKREDLPDNPLIITIDDGYRDNYTVAWPVLKQYNVPATIFLTTDFIDKKRWLWSNQLEYTLRNTKRQQFSFPLVETEETFLVDSFTTWHETQLKIFNHCRHLDDRSRIDLLKRLADHLRVDVPEESCGDFEPLSWDEIREMQKAGIAFGSHTRTHPILSRLDPAALQEEVTGSRKLLENKLQQEVRGFCYPNGQPADISKGVVDQVRQAGYRCAVTTITGYNQSADHPFLLKRYSVLSPDPHFLLETLTPHPYYNGRKNITTLIKETG